MPVEVYTCARRFCGSVLRAVNRLFAKKFNAVDSTAVLDFFNARPIPPNAYRVLFIGDSLTIHGRSRKLWDYFSGMAASCPEKDFVHLSMRYIQEMRQEPVEILYNNGGNGKIESMFLYLKMHPELLPDLVIFQGGENDAFDENFRATYRSILGEFSRMIVLGDWWSDEKSEFSRHECSRFGIPFADLRAIERDPANSGDGGPYGIDGVAKHPNDAGMMAISHAIAFSVNQHLDWFRPAVVPEMAMAD